MIFFILLLQFYIFFFNFQKSLNILLLFFLKVLQVKHYNQNIFNNYKILCTIKN